MGLWSKHFLLVSFLMLCGKLVESKGLCQFARMFPFEGKNHCFKISEKVTRQPSTNETLNEDKDMLYTHPYPTNTEHDHSTIKDTTDRATYPQDSFNYSCPDEMVDINSSSTEPTDCLDIYNAGFGSGIYNIKPNSWPGSSFGVYCNMGDEGGWTVFQRRVNGSVDFYRGWEGYRQGFGCLNHEFWLGNDKIAALTHQKDYQLRIDFINSLGSPYFATYTLFRIGYEADNYRLTHVGTFSGTAGYNALRNHKGYAFTTRDRDNDEGVNINCAVKHHGAWWYHSCHSCNLNGGYFYTNFSGIQWHSLPGDGFNIQHTEMKIRPKET